MQTLREAVNSVHLENAKELNALGEQVAQAQDVIARVRRAFGSIIQIPSAEQLQHQRDEQIQREMDCALALRGLLREHGFAVATLPSATACNAICAVIQRLRYMEQSQAFHRSLLEAQRETSSTSEYTLENFAFGRTPLPTWLQLVSIESVRTAIAGVRDASRDGEDASTQRQCTVFGSSTGSLVFYAALALGVDCVGVEILPFLSKVATQIRDELLPRQAQRRRCEFVCGDMLQAPLDATGLLILTSQCWDSDLHDQVVRKLERELPPDAVVVDYKDSLRRSSSFLLEASLEGVPVSWTQKQPLYVFRKHTRQ